MPLFSTVQPTSNAWLLQLPIPPAVAQALNLQPGQSLQWSLDPKDGQVLLRRVDSAPTPPAAAAPAGKKGARHC